LVRELAGEPARGVVADPRVRGVRRRGRTRSRPRVSRPRVFVARVIPDEGLRPILEACDAVVWPDELPPARDELLRAVEGCDGVLTLLTDRVDGELLDAAGPQ